MLLKKLETETWGSFNADSKNSRPRTFSKHRNNSKNELFIKIKKFIERKNRARRPPYRPKDLADRRIETAALYKVGDDLGIYFKNR